MKLFLKEIKDRYIQENFKRIQRNTDLTADKLGSSGGITNNYTTVTPTVQTKYEREIFEIPTDIVADQITLIETPILKSEVVILNGLVLTEGANCDYTYIGNVISFNTDVLTADGMVRVDYAFI